MNKFDDVTMVTFGKHGATKNPLLPEDYGDESYSVEIETLEKLMDFQQQIVHPIIITSYIPRIEIYDGYREILRKYE